MSIFNNYDNLPKNYIPNNSYINSLPYKQIIRPIEEYSCTGDFIGFSWHFKDSILIELITEGKVIYDNGSYEEAKDYLQNKKFNICIYNFKYECIYENEYYSQSRFNFIIDKDLSKLMVPGIYYILVKLIDEENNIQQTLLDFDTCKFIVR